MQPGRKLLLLGLFSVAMANLEASLVVYARMAFYPDDLRSIFPLVLLPDRTILIELGRELATLLLLLTVSLLAVQGTSRRLAAFFYLFGLWDLGYYLWLKLMIGWPVSWLEWDVLFLIPWPWLGPWIGAAAIALLFTAWGAWTLLRDIEARLSAGSVAVFLVGSGLALASFLLPIIPQLAQGLDAIPQFQPKGFCWSLYLAGYLLMAFSLWRVSARP